METMIVPKFVVTPDVQKVLDEYHAVLLQSGNDTWLSFPDMPAIDCVEFGLALNAAIIGWS